MPENTADIAPMTTKAIKPAIRPYSIAVAPRSSRMNLTNAGRDPEPRESAIHPSPGLRYPTVAKD
jgi:hypothetical protein